MSHQAGSPCLVNPGLGPTGAARDEVSSGAASEVPDRWPYIVLMSKNVKLTDQCARLRTKLKTQAASFREYVRRAEHAVEVQERRLDRYWRAKGEYFGKLKLLVTKANVLVKYFRLSRARYDASAAMIEARRNLSFDDDRRKAASDAHEFAKEAEFNARLQTLTCVGAHTTNFDALISEERFDGDESDGYTTTDDEEIELGQLPSCSSCSSSS